MDLSGKKCAELQELCRSRGLPVSGTKLVLIARLTGSTPPPAKPRAKRIAKTKCSETPSKALIHARSQCPAIIICKNQYGNFEHKETGFVFDKETKQVIGKQVGDKVERLKISDMEICKSCRFMINESCVDAEFSQESTTERLRELLQMENDSEDSDNE